MNKKQRRLQEEFRKLYERREAYIDPFHLQSKFTISKITFAIWRILVITILIFICTGR